MNKIILISLCLFLVFACNNKDGKNNTGKIPVVDVTKSYPKKEFKLQEIADVKYIPLATNDSVLLEEYSKFAYASNDTIIAFNHYQGDIFIFDGQGKFLSKFNKKGQGAGEYSKISNVIFDHKQKELFVTSKKVVLVYGTNGNLKRSFKFDKKYRMGDIKSYNDSLLLCYDNKEYLFWANAFPGEKPVKIEHNLYPFVFMSKTDGHFISSVNFEVRDKFPITVFGYTEDGVIEFHPFHEHCFTKLNNEYIINNFAADTVCILSSDQSLSTFIIKKPSIKDMPENKKTWLDILAINDKYVFMRTAYKTGNKKGKAFKTTYLCLDRQNNEISNYQLIDLDNKDNKITSPTTYKIAPDKLLDALSEGKLSGKLKDLAQKLDEDDNPVLVKISLKK